MGQSENLLLNSMPQNVFAALEPHLNTVNVRFGEVVAETEQPITRVYFPHHCVISLVVEMEVGDLIETAMVGRDGVANATAALDGKIALHRGIVQVGGDASVIAPDALRAIANDFEPFRSILIGTNRCYWRRRNNQQGAMRATLWSLECAVGCCASGT